MFSGRQAGNPTAEVKVLLPALQKYFKMETHMQIGLIGLSTRLGPCWVGVRMCINSFMSQEVFEEVCSPLTRWLHLWGRHI